MKVIKTSVSINYSYLVNNQLSTVKCTTPTTLEIQIMTSEDILLELTPIAVDNAKWNDLLPYHLKINNISQQTIQTLKVKIDTPEALPLIVSSLRNIETNVVYDITDSENYFTINEPILKNSNMTLRFATNLKYAPDNNGYTQSPLTYNAFCSTLNIPSNLATVNINEFDISLQIQNEGKSLSFENKGAINSAPFSYKCLPPQNTSSLKFTGSQSQNASYSKLGKYYILKIPSLPKSIFENKEILYANFI